MTPDKIFKLIQDARYITSGLDVDWATFIDIDKTLYVLFQGSTTKSDWVHNFEVWPMPCKPYKNMKHTWYCHAGIAKMYKSVRDEIRDAVELIQEDLPCTKIIVAGHSQGGGIAQLCAEDLAYIGNKVECVTFGSPKVFYGSGAKDHIGSLGLRAMCYQNGSDIVPTVPPGAYVINPVHVGDPFCLLKTLDTAKYHMEYWREDLYMKC